MPEMSYYGRRAPASVVGYLEAVAPPGHVPKKRPVIWDYSVDTVNRSCSLEFKMPINISFCANNKNKYNFMADHFFAGQPLTINFG